ncbi:MAG: hypothetical protein K0B02_04715 [DPANN group archaeon]|nr:hypothetical protein [DPANN group archaeon]
MTVYPYNVTENKNQKAVSISINIQKKNENDASYTETEQILINIPTTLEIIYSSIQDDYIMIKNGKKQTRI